MSKEIKTLDNLLEQKKLTEEINKVALDACMEASKKELKDELMNMVYIKDVKLTGNILNGNTADVVVLITVSSNNNKFYFQDISVHKMLNDCSWQVKLSDSFKTYLAGGPKDAASLVVTEIRRTLRRA